MSENYSQNRDFSCVPIQGVSAHADRDPRTVGHHHTARLQKAALNGHNLVNGYNGDMFTSHAFNWNMYFHTSFHRIYNFQKSSSI